jgi:phosphopantetheinyl transferase
MKPLALAFVPWPQVPTLPPPEQPVLVRVETSTRRAVARQQVRDAARQILAAWSGGLSSPVPWHETPQGPVCAGLLGGHAVAMSFSYSGEAGWIGLLRGGAIGIDAMRIGSFAEMEAVAQLYLGPAAGEAIFKTHDPARAFALAWTEREATLKCQRRGLSERQEEPAAPEGRIRGRHIHCHDDTVVTVVTAPTEREENGPIPSRYRVDLDEGGAGAIAGLRDQGGVAARIQRE